MERLTIRVPPSMLEEIEERADQEDVSRSEAARQLLQRGMEADRWEQEAERLRREKRLILEQRDEHTELVRAVSREQSREDRRAQAGVLTRAKWWLTGMPTDDEKE